MYNFEILNFNFRLTTIGQHHIEKLSALTSTKTTPTKTTTTTTTKTTTMTNTTTTTMTMTT
jgi:hypothetical protein